jgi:hypothetical protein
VLYSENALVSGRVKSCGCLRRAQNDRAHLEKVSREQFRFTKKEITLAIQKAQFELRALRTRPESRDRNNRMAFLGGQLRKLFALKGYANRKDVPKDTVARKLREIKDER